MESLQRGDIVTVAFPYTDLTMLKRRPALVLNEKTEEGDVILAFIGTHFPAKATATSIILLSTDQDFSSTGLKSDSVLRLDKLATPRTPPYHTPHRKTYLRPDDCY
ncbi:type II toxin-antitoxin system PemK/MazF family toxin [candidate division KSB1 bacterium]|nr:type II toxin-antitoxin system PemK/MazF family toxin [candidate division KSB1 bacterium]